MRAYQVKLARPAGPRTRVVTRTRFARQQGEVGRDRRPRILLPPPGDAIPRSGAGVFRWSRSGRCMRQGGRSALRSRNPRRDGGCPCEGNAGWPTAGVRPGNSRPTRGQWDNCTHGQEPIGSRAWWIARAGDLGPEMVVRPDPRPPRLSIDRRADPSARGAEIMPPLK